MLKGKRGRGSLVSGNFSCMWDSKEQKRGQAKLSFTGSAQMAEETGKGGFSHLRPNPLLLKNLSIQWLSKFFWQLRWFFYLFVVWQSGEEHRLSKFF